MQHDIPSFESLAPEYQQWLLDYERRFKEEGHTWPVDELGPTPPTPDWWTEEDEKSCHTQREPVFDMLTRSKQPAFQGEVSENGQK